MWTEIKQPCSLMYSACILVRMLKKYRLCSILCEPHPLYITIHKHTQDRWSHSAVVTSRCQGSPSLLPVWMWCCDICGVKVPLIYNTCIWLLRVRTVYCRAEYEQEFGNLIFTTVLDSNELIYIHVNCRFNWNKKVLLCFGLNIHYIFRTSLVRDGCWLNN